MRFYGVTIPLMVSIIFKSILKLFALTIDVSELLFRLVQEIILFISMNATHSRIAMTMSLEYS